MEIAEHDIERFLSRVEIASDSECWEWKRGKTPAGYGMFYVDGNKPVYAHRFSYMIHIGEIPEGMSVCHTCDNPGCVNPAHLWVGTITENNQDRDRKGRTRPGAARGEASAKAKLTAGDVVNIRQRASDRKWGIITQLAQEYGVSPTTIQHIVHRRNWAHVK